MGFGVYKLTQVSSFPLIAGLDPEVLVNHFCFTMSTVSIRDLRTSFPKVEALLNAGEEVWISKRGKPFARIVLDTPPLEEPPDFKARFGPYSKTKAARTKSGKPLQDFLRWRDHER